MEKNLSEQLAKAGSLGADLVKYAVMALVVVAVLYVLLRVLRGRKKPVVLQVPELGIDVMQLGTQAPPSGPPSLEFYNVPVRLAAVVIAPAGRVRDLPPIDQWEDLFDAIVPGLAAVVAKHKPLVRRWPPQLSAKGFAHTFFQHVRLPGEGGKGTPWSSAGGLFKIEGQPLMAGLVLRTAQPSSHGQEIVDSEEQWMRLLKVVGA